MLTAAASQCVEQRFSEYLAIIWGKVHLKSDHFLAVFSNGNKFFQHQTKSSQSCQIIGVRGEGQILLQKDVLFEMKIFFEAIKKGVGELIGLYPSPCVVDYWYWFAS